MSYGLVTQCRQNNIPIAGPILKEKAKLFATNLGIKNFQASKGWLEPPQPASIMYRISVHLSMYNLIVLRGLLNYCHDCIESDVR